MLSIDEAILLERQISKDQIDRLCDLQHEQIANWLEELKEYQDKNKMVVRGDCDFENIYSIKNKIDELSKYAESQYNKAIDDVLKLPKYKFYDTSKEFMNIRIDAISIEDILKLKEKTNEQRKQSKPNRND